jgi:hypothetical protein
MTAKRPTSTKAAEALLSPAAPAVFVVVIDPRRAVATSPPLEAARTSS